MKLTKAIVGGTFAFVACASANAAHLDNSPIGLLGTFVTQTFDVPVVDTYTLAGNLFPGVVFDSNMRVATGGSFPNTSGQHILNYAAGGCTNCVTPTSFSFSSNLSAIAFVLVTNPGTSTISAYEGNDLVESFSAITDYSGNYFGFTGITFSKIVIDSGGSNHALVLDNLQTAPIASIPEPETYAMMLAGLGLLGLSARRQRQKLNA